MKDNNQSWIEKRLSKIEHQQEKILGMLNKIIKKEEQITIEEEKNLDLEKEILQKEQQDLKDETKEIDELEEIEKLEKKIEKEVKINPLKKITFRDITKGSIGAFFGLVGHFAFAEGQHIGEHFSMTRSIMLLILSFFIIVAFLYFAGFRKIEDKMIIKLFPLRAIVLYTISIITILLVLLIYDKINLHSSFQEIIKTVAATSILAVIGASTADLLGKNEE